MILISGCNFKDINGGLGSILQVSSEVPINAVLYNSIFENIVTDEGGIITSINVNNLGVSIIESTFKNVQSEANGGIVSLEGFKRGFADSSIDSLKILKS